MLSHPPVEVGSSGRQPDLFIEAPDSKRTLAALLERPTYGTYHCVEFRLATRVIQHVVSLSKGWMVNNSLDSDDFLRPDMSYTKHIETSNRRILTSWLSISCVRRFGSIR